MSKSSQSCWASHKTAIDGVCAHTRTHRHKAIISFSFGYCCHRQFFLLLPLYSLGACIGRIVWKLVMGEMGACVILSFHCPFPLYFFIPLTISLFCLPSCLLFLPRSLTVWPSCRSNSHPSLMAKMTMHYLSPFVSPSLLLLLLLLIFSGAQKALSCQSAACVKVWLFSHQGPG